MKAVFHKGRVFKNLNSYFFILLWYYIPKEKVMDLTGVLDVAHYVLEKCGQLTTLKLQKLVYYCQAWSLAWDEEPLFEEDFQAWANGPVCRELYDIHKGMYRIDVDTFNHVPNEEFTADQIETMDSVIRYYGGKDSHWLSELTHKERPWKETRKGYALGEACSEVISKALMQEYYGGLIGEEED